MEKAIMKKRSLTEKEALEKGIKTNHEQMPNGSYRYRLISNDGSGYVRTEAGNDRIWEGAHYHNTTEELVVIQKGWMIYVTLNEKELDIEVIKEGQFRLIKKGEKHNSYLSKNAIVHTLKFGNIEPNDWIACPEIDIMTSKITEDELMKYI